MSPRTGNDHGVVILAALDVRRRPDHAAEMTSQLLMGETIEVLAASRDGGWRRVRNRSDGYEGWARIWGLRMAGRTRVDRWVRKATARVVVPFTEVRSMDPGGHPLTPLFLNNRVIPGRRTGRRRAVELPDGRRGWVETSALTVGRRPTLTLVDRIRGLLGTPYLWGGRTPLGFDCSGFAQQVLAEQGRTIPRDAHEQFRSIPRVAGADRTRLGDLVFFGAPRERIGHVGVVLGGAYYAHCRGSVRVNSLDPGSPFCDKGLCAMVRGFGRPGNNGF